MANKSLKLIKMKKRIILNHAACMLLWLALVFLLIPALVNGQSKSVFVSKPGEIAVEGSKPKWITFKEGLSMTAEALVSEKKEALRLGDDDKMISHNVKNDDLGFTHTRFHQYYKGVKIQSAEFIVHEKGGMLKTANGVIVSGINMDVSPVLTENMALDSALSFIGAEEYLWQNADAEKVVKKQMKDSAATYFPKGRLVLASPPGSEEITAEGLRLCWSFDIYTHKPGNANRVFINAKTGSVFRVIPLSMSCDPDVATGTTTWYGSGYNFRVSKSGGDYYMKDNCYDPTLWVRDYNGGSISEYYDVNNVWNATSQNAQVQSMWGAEMIYSYYNSKFGRTSWNGGNADIIAINEASINGDVTNACWGCDGNVMSLGAGNTSDPTDDWNTIDIEGHEFTHGVVQSEAGLDYEKQSGALNESFADIFGTCVERYAEGGANPDWTLGEEIGAFRSMENPGSYNDPDTYAGTNWVTTSGCTPSTGNDYCGVHTNSGVQNKWFFLLSDGESGTNDNGDDYNVTGIGISKAAEIAYRNLTVYLTSTSNYHDAREGALQSAKDLYGNCSNEAIQCGEAWYAVGVGVNESYYDDTFSGTLTTGTYEAVHKATATGTVNPGNVVTIKAAKMVSLKPPFHAYGGSATTAKINACSIAKESKSALP